MGASWMNEWIHKWVLIVRVQSLSIITLCFLKEKEIHLVPMKTHPYLSSISGLSCSATITSLQLPIGNFGSWKQISFTLASWLFLIYSISLMVTSTTPHLYICLRVFLHCSSWPRRHLFGRWMGRLSDSVSFSH